MSAAKRLRIAAMFASPPQRPAQKPEVAIRDVRAYAIREPDSGRSWITVVIETDSGLKGFGDFAASPDAETAKAALLRHRQALIGQDALANLAIEKLLLAAPAGVRAAVDMALLDIQGKRAGVPLYELLAGRTRDKVRGLAILGAEAGVDEARSAGFRAFAVPLALPSGPTRGRAFYADTYRRVSGLRREGEDVVLDCAGRTTAAEAAVLAAQFEKFHLLWLDEPASEINQEALRKISDNSVTPLGWGRSMTDNSELQDLLRMQVIDVFRPDLTRLGFSRARRGAALAEAHYTAVGIYHRCGPVATAAAIQLAASIPNSFAVDVPMPGGAGDRRLRADLGGTALEKATDGFLELPQGPGLGLELDENLLRKYGA
jgi:galactonate dehydratase